MSTRHRGPPLASTWIRARDGRRNERILQKILSVMFEALREQLFLTIRENHNA